MICRLLGNKEGICNSWGGSPKKFGVGHGALSTTSNVDWMVGYWLGDEKNQLVTILDTPGTGDVQVQDNSPLIGKIYSFDISRIIGDHNV